MLFPDQWSLTLGVNPRAFELKTFIFIILFSTFSNNQTIIIESFAHKV